MRIDWAADVLRAALTPHGYNVIEHDGWTHAGNGELVSLDAFVWHHDASASGYSPGMADYIRRQVDAGKPGAQMWVALPGDWHLLASGLTYHAGEVIAGKPDNKHSAGIETDHTTGEDIGLFLLDSLRIGTAALLNHLQRGPDVGLEFHKTICRPRGRKPDPHGLDLSTERAAVTALMKLKETDMPFSKEERDSITAVNWLATAALQTAERVEKKLDALAAEIAAHRKSG